LKPQENKMQEISFEDTLEQILARDARYHRDAYIFVREALDFTQKTNGRDGHTSARHRGGAETPEKHVTGQELLTGIRQYALASFGPMTITVFLEWGITECRDFGNIVFNMVETRLLSKTDNDSPDDFASGYDFDEAFRQPYLPADKLNKISGGLKTTRN
jgi:uncharacterized repeat protein (TIGR04138 family)